MRSRAAAGIARRVARRAMSLRRRLAVAAALLLALALGWKLLGLTLGHADLRRDPAAAVRRAPQDAAAEVALAQRELAAGDRVGAARRARTALRISPLAAGAWRVLGEAALQRGDAAAAEARFRIAARLDPRDVATQSWLAAAALRAGRLQDALWHLDAVLRVRPGLAPALDPQLLALALAPGAQPAWTAVFAAQPPWAPGFFAWACARPVADNAAVDALAAALRATPAGLGADEWNAYLERLLGQQRWMAAYLAWVQSLGPAQRAHLDNVYNGDFREPVSNRGFDWRIGYVPGAELGVVPISGAPGRAPSENERPDSVHPRSGAPGRALEVRFLDRRAAFSGQVRELLALAPGHYRLSGLARLDDLRNERGLQWTVSCAGDGRLIGATARLRGSQPWRPFSTDLSVPASGCGAQWLALRLDYRIPAEQWAGGSARYTALRVVRVAAAPRREPPAARSRRG